ncbi:MAG: SPASM domain-containing protein [Chloroflexi bacterium]|nr:SPASM domain-containing protein [Chloroflexota bacterium]MBI3341394.1 SPASM domain-containing protein [Chloroflexota bacterium]
MTTPKILLSSDSKDFSAREECDCACADTAVMASDIQYKVGGRLFRPELHFQPLLDDYKVVFNPKTDSDTAVLDSSAMSILNSFQSTRSVRLEDPQNVVGKMIKAGLLERVDGDITQICAAPPQILSAWIHVTDRCNLRCSYCYLPHVREDMSLETGRAAIDAIFRSAVIHDYRQIKIKYAGGEPLLRFSLIEELHEYANRLAGEHDVALDDVVLSNGTLLTPAIAQTLKTRNIRLMISLDGLGQYHDSQRSYAGGHGTFDDVVEAVMLALDCDVIPHISVTISSRTADGLPKLMSWMLKYDLPFSLNFYRENELSASNIDMRMDEEKIIAGMLAAFKIIESDLPKRNLLPSLVDRANLSSPHSHTCGVGQNYLVFDQNGQVAKCQMHIRKPITDVHVADPLAVIRADQIGVQNLPVQEKEGCRTCEWKNWCAGGCPITTHRATGRYDVKSPNCNIYKTLYPEALRLEGLRLLKYQDDPEVVIAL